MSADRESQKRRRAVNSKFKSRDRGDWGQEKRPKRKGAWKPSRWEIEQRNPDTRLNMTDL